MTAANVLDGVIVVLVAASGLVAFGFDVILHASGEPVAWVATNVVYPVADIPVLGLTILGIAVGVARASDRVRESLRRSGLEARIGEERFYPAVGVAVAALAGPSAR